MPLAFWRLIRVGLVVLGPVLSIYLLMQWAVLPELRARGERLLQNSAATIREGVDQFCGHWLSQAESNAADPAFQSMIDGDSQELRDAAMVEAKVLLDHLLGMQRFAVWDSSQTLILERGGSGRFAGGLLQAALRETISSSEPRVLSLPVSSTVSEPVFLFLVPIRKTGKAVGSLGLEVSGGEVQALLRNRRDEAGSGAFGVVYDEKGRLLVSSFFPPPDWIEKVALDPALAGRLASLPSFDPKTRERLPEKTSEFRQTFVRSQDPQIFTTRHRIEGENHRVVLERAQRVPWVITYQAPNSTLTGMLDRAGLLILLIGLIAVGVAFFAFQPDRRTFDSLRSLRPEAAALAIGIILAGMTLFLRHQVFQLAEQEAQASSGALASSCSRQIEDHFRVRSGLLRDFSEELIQADSPDVAFRARAERLRRDFGGTLLVRWDSPPKDGPRGVWIEGDRQIENAKPLPAAQDPAEANGSETKVAFFEYPGGGEGILIVSRLDGEGRMGWIFWAESLAEVLRRILSFVPSEGYQVTVVSGTKRFPLLPEFRAAEDLVPQKRRVSLPGEDWEVEVEAGESHMGHRYAILGLVVTVLGFVLAGGGAAAAYFAGTNSASLREVSSKDELTGIRNRRSFNEMMEREISIADRYRRPLSLMLLDLDHFKRINDTMGHAIGDEVLRVAADVLQKAVRETDVPFRFGGEEFAVLMAETDLVAASGIAERIRGSMESAPISTEKGPVHLTISIGVTGFQSGESVDQFLTRADMALYRAKAEGRNRVVVDRPVGWEA